MFRKYPTTKDIIKLGIYRKFFMRKSTENSSKSGLYIIKFNNGVKIGVASNIKKRINSYRSPWCRDFEAIAVYQTSNPIYIENILKERFRLSTKPGSNEFFYDVDFEKIVNYVENNRFYKKK